MRKSFTFLFNLILATITGILLFKNFAPLGQQKPLPSLQNSVPTPTQPVALAYINYLNLAQINGSSISSQKMSKGRNKNRG